VKPRPHILDATRHRQRRPSENDAPYIDDGRFEMGGRQGVMSNPVRRRRRRRR
jgi:hypothetical protein